jgi:hypothetical protein
VTFDEMFALADHKIDGFVIVKIDEPWKWYFLSFKELQQITCFSLNNELSTCVCTILIILFMFL